MNQPILVTGGSGTLGRRTPAKPEATTAEGRT
jgi:uncharacterized protein YbjT (DUF2867 family)